MGKKTVLVINPPEIVRVFWSDSVKGVLAVGDTVLTDLRFKVVQKTTILQRPIKKGQFCAVVVFGEDKREYAKALANRFAADMMGIKVVLVVDPQESGGNLYTVYDAPRTRDTIRQVIHIASL